MVKVVFQNNEDELDTSKCEYCRNEFKQTTVNKKYCSYNCRDEMYELRKKIRDEVKEKYLKPHKDEINKEVKTKLNKELKKIQKGD